MKKIVVNDTNIFIDLYSIGLLEEITSLDFIFYTNSFVLSELKEDASIVEALKDFNIEDFNLKRMKRIQGLYIQYNNRKVSSNVSFTDCSVLLQALDLEAILLTGDKKLRKVAEENGIEVHGTLFLLNKLVEEGMLKPIEAITKIKELQGINHRLPLGEINRLIQSWNKD